MVEGVSHSLVSSRREDLQVEPPVSCRYSPTFHCYTTLARRLGATRIGHQVVEMGQAREKRLLVSTGMMKPLHCEQLPLDGVVGLVSEGAGHRHLRIGEHRVPARLLALEPVPDALAVGYPSRRGDVIGKVPEPLPQGTHPQALALARPGPQGGKLGA